MDDFTLPPGILRNRPLNWSIALSFVAMFFFYQAVTMCAKASNNSLRVGPLSIVPDGTLVKINPLAHFNYLSRNEVLAMRIDSVMANKLLINEPYEPSAPVFGEIINGKPWWGMAGQYIWGEGLRSIEGPAEESRFILNPFLLVAANPWTARIWNAEQITEGDISDPDFPYTWTPLQLKYWPRKKTAQVVYDVTAFNGKLKEYDSKREITAENVKFGLVAYNARDFGYEYMFVSPALSSNITNAKQVVDPVEIKQFIHTGDSSKYPGGCNNMSPAVDEIDQLSVTQLPARVTVLLWKKEPQRATEAADFTFVLDFK